MSFVIFTLFALITMPVVACVTSTMIHLLVTCGEWLDANIPLEASVSIVDGKLTAAVEVKDNLSLVDLNSEDDVLEDWEFETDLAFFDRAFKAGQRMDAIMLHNECGSNRLPCMATF